MQATTSALITLSATSKEKTRRRGLYVALNLAMTLTVCIAFAMNGKAEAGAALYVVLLFALCTAPLLTLSSFRDRGVLLLLFLAVYFASLGLQDIAALLSGQATVPAWPRKFIFTAGESAILLGAVCVIVGYAVAASLIPRRYPGILQRDWSPRISTFLGIAFWLIGFCFAASLQFGVADLQNRVSFDPRIAGFFAMFRLLQPLGTLILIYQYLTFRRKGVLIVLLATMAADIALGFLGDTKELAIRGPLLYLVCLVGLRDRVPLIGTVVFVLLAGILFNVFGQYRDMLATRAMSREKAVQNLGSVFDRLHRNGGVGQRLTQGMQYLSSRVGLKYYVEVVVARTGHGVDFQNGTTIKPLLYAFIPRFILPNKEDNAMTGRLFNREFHLSESEYVFIAMGQLGELYWNFGWIGLVVGMMIIGAFMTLLSSAVSLEVRQTLPRFLLLLGTVYVVALRFEDAIALTYTLWARFAVMLLLLHAFIPKAPRDTSPA